MKKLAIIESNPEYLEGIKEAIGSVGAHVLIVECFPKKPKPRFYVLQQIVQDHDVVILDTDLETNDFRGEDLIPFCRRGATVIGTSVLKVFGDKHFNRKKELGNDDEAKSELRRMVEEALN